MKTKIFNYFQNLIICFSLAAIISGVVSPAVNAASGVYKPLSGKTVSVLGDSISTFENVSSGKGAETSNSTIKNNAVFFTKGKNGVYLDDTWWMQFINELGGTLLVNNSYSASRVFNPDAPHTSSSSYYKRCINLHDNTGNNAGEKPDVIMIYLGYNDHSRGSSTIGDYASIDYASLIKTDGSDVTYSEPKTTCEAYVIMLHKIKNLYPDAEVYCLNLPYRGNLSEAYEARIRTFNSNIKKIVKDAGFIYVDTFEESGLPVNGTIIYNFNGDYVHPNKNGMDAITSACLNTFYKNSKYVEANNKFHTVRYDLDGVISDSGTPKIIPHGEDFSITLSTYDYSPFEVTVKSGDKNITKDCYKNGHIIIDSVTDNLTIYAKDVSREKQTDAYRFNIDDGAFINIENSENTRNSVNEISFDNSNKAYSLEKPFVLNADAPWSIVWRATGSTNKKHTLLSVYRNTNKERNFAIVFDESKSMIYFTHYINGSYNQYGVDLTKHEIDITTPHTYRLTNAPTTRSTNMINLYIDGKLIAPLTSYYINNQYSGENLVWCNNIDFSFGYLGATNKGIKANNMEFLQVWENEVPDTHTHNYIYTHKHIVTCVTDGYIEHVCECGDSKRDITEEATGHKMGDWETEILGSVYSNGLMVRRCTVCSDIIKSKELPQLKTKAPVISSIKNNEKGIKLSWNTVSGADSYRVYRRLSGTKGWKLIGTTTKLSYIDTNVKNANKYQYTVRAKNEAGLSELSNIKTLKHVKAPVITSLTNKTNGIQIKWGKIASAKSYRVYRKRSDSSSWKFIGKTTSNYYLDKQTKKFSGTTYCYTVRAENGVLSGYNASGTPIERLSTPSLNSAVNVKSGIKITWEPSDGCDGYYIYRKTKGTGWRVIGAVSKKKQCFIDTKATNGTTYTYTVKSYSGEYRSGFDSKGVSCKAK